MANKNEPRLPITLKRIKEKTAKTTHVFRGIDTELKITLMAETGCEEMDSYDNSPKKLKLSVAYSKNLVLFRIGSRGKCCETGNVERSVQETKNIHCQNSLGDAVDNLEKLVNKNLLAELVSEDTCFD